MDKHLISIIIPVYNVEAYLRRCIDSVISQTYKNLEIILVDDGSTDTSGKICDEYAQKDMRINVIHKENGGLSDARNVGIDLASGEYFAFIDSDDYVCMDYIDKLLNAILIGNADIAFCSYIKVSDKKYKKLRNFPEKFQYFSSEEMLRNWHGKYKHIETVAWNKLYKSSLFLDSGIRYPKGYYNEDVQTTHLLVKESGKIAITNQILYFYVQRNDSIMGKITRKKLVDAIASQDIRLNFFYSNHYEDAYKRLLVKYLKYCILMCVKVGDKKIKQDMYAKYLEKKTLVNKYDSVEITDKVLFRMFETYYYVIKKCTKGEK